MTEPAPPARRDGLYALVLAGLVAAALLVGYRAGPAPAAVADNAESAGDLATSETDRPRSAAEVATGFAVDEAFAMAGAEVPADVQSYSFFAYTTDAPAEQEIEELTKRLVEASKAKEFLGICGPDAARNRRNLVTALEANHGQDLSGVIILFLGPESEREAVTKAAARAGAPLRFLLFPPAKPAA